MTSRALAVAKVDNWIEALFREIERSQDMPFAWHDNDCASFACRCVLVMTNVDCFADYRDTYSGRFDAQRTVLRGDGLRGIASHWLGEPLPAAFNAQRGDVVLVDNQGHPALAICTGGYACTPGELGLVFQPMHQWLVAWRVGGA